MTLLNSSKFRKRYTKNIFEVAYDEKPIHCPNCNSIKLADIGYGHPIFCDELTGKLDRGELILGGCIVQDSNPSWECVDCHMQLMKKD